jgi:hypothetical protein
MISVILLFVVGLAYSYREWREFRGGSLENRYGFWGKDSWVRKYKYEFFLGALSFECVSKRNLYYRIFGIRYKEAFPFSATALVWLTDWYHAFQFVMLKAIFLAVYFREDWNNWPLEVGSYAAAYYLGFNLIWKRQR